MLIFLPTNLCKKYLFFQHNGILSIFVSKSKPKYNFETKIVDKVLISE